jgi:Family of unknown function (DUF5684)
VDYYHPNYGLELLFGVFFAAIYVLFLLGFYALNAWFLSLVFRKAGIKQWKAWVPVYNYWVFLELGGQQGWLAILVLIPIANVVGLVFICIAAYNVGLAFAKEGVWVVLYIFLPWLWLAIIGFDASRWEPWRSPAQPLYGANVSPPPAAA